VGRTLHVDRSDSTAPLRRFTGKFLVAKLGLSELILKAAVGSEMFLVAGADSEL
jgi:hypothetical protein